MNKRIQELIEKATIRGVEYRPGDDGHPTPTFYFDKEKFAELIVRECMDAVGNDPMAQPYIQRIKAKFGVEYYEPIEKAFGVEE